jgi:hypothetical protein
MHDTSAIRTEIADSTSVSPEPPTCSREADKQIGLHVIHAPRDETCTPRDERLHPFGRRGTSWLPGAWGDPF